MAICHGIHLHDQVVRKSTMNQKVTKSFFFFALQVGYLSIG